MVLAFLSAAALAEGPVAPVQETENQALTDTIYQLDFAKARAVARELDAKDPASPKTAFYRSVINWQEYTVNKTGGEKLLADFFHDNEETIRRAQALLSAPNADEGYFYLGGAYGFRARVNVTQKDFLSAFTNAKKGVVFLKRSLALNPNRVDVHMGFGMYHYYLTKLPRGVRGIAGMMLGTEANRDLGLQELHRVSAEGTDARIEAMSILSKIYVYPEERQYDKALPLLQFLVNRYPSNIDFELRLIDCYQRMNRWEEALLQIETFDALLSGGIPWQTPDWREELEYRRGETLLALNHSAEAGHVLQRLTNSNDPVRLAWTLLRLGEIEELSGDRNEAVLYYRKVQDDAKAEDLAAQFLRKKRLPQIPLTLKPRLNVF